jgi:hypothetical protein
LTRGWGEGTSMAPQWRGEAPKGVTTTVVEQGDQRFPPVPNKPHQPPAFSRAGETSI